MKVLLVTPSYDPIVGGAETFVRRLATKLNELGIHADVMTLSMNQKWKPSLEESLEKREFTIFRVPAISNPLALFLRARYRLFRFNVIPKLGFTRLFHAYDIIHFCDESDLSLALFSLFVRKPKIMHMLTPICFEEIRRNFFQKRLFKRIADIYIPDSFQIPLLQQIGIAKTRIVNMDSVSVDTCTFMPDESKRLDSLVLYVGRLQKHKGVHVLLQSLLNLKIPVHLVIIGPFDSLNQQYSDEIENRVHLINAQGMHKVELLGCMNEKELIPWYQKAALLVAPHLDGTAGLTTLEALACATPVIATGTMLVKDGVNGLLVPPNDAERLAAALSELLTDKELRKKYGSNGRRIVEKQYSWEKITMNTIKVYEKIPKN